MTCCLSEDVEEDMFNPVHRLKARCPTPTDWLPVSLFFIDIEPITCSNCIKFYIALPRAIKNTHTKCEADKMSGTFSRTEDTRRHRIP